MDERDVGFFNAAAAELLRKPRMRGIMLRDNQGTRGAAIQAVHNSGTKISAAGRQLFTPMKKRVDQRASGISGARMNRHTGGLIDDEHVGIFVEDFERNILRFG